MITHGCPSDWGGWAMMLFGSLVAARLCYRQGRLVGMIDGEVVDLFYLGLMIVFLIFAFIVFIHAPFHVSITSR